MVSESLSQDALAKRNLSSAKHQQNNW